MWLKRKKVLCSQCGFLGWQNIAPDGSYLSSEVMTCVPEARDKFQAGEFNGKAKADPDGNYSLLRCHALQWRLDPSITKQTGFFSPPETIRQPRQCRQYVKYDPAYSPQDHKDLRREAETRRTIIKASLLAALIGATAAIVAQILLGPHAPSP